MFQVVETINGAVLWANLHLLFWLSLFPFTTAWIDESELATVPLAVYGTNLLLAAVAYYLLQLAIFRTAGGQVLRRALGRDAKGKASPVLYLCGIGAAFFAPWLSVAVYTAVAALWLVPDRRVERYLAESRPS